MTKKDSLGAWQTILKNSCNLCNSWLKNKFGAFSGQPKEIKKTQDKNQKIQDELALNKISEDKIQQKKIKSKEYELKILKLQAKLTEQQEDLSKILD